MSVLLSSFLITDWVLSVSYLHRHPKSGNPPRSQDYTEFLAAAMERKAVAFSSAGRSVLEVSFEVCSLEFGGLRA